MGFVMIRTNNHWIEIYSTKSLNDDPFFTLHLRSSARIHSTSSGMFYVLTSYGFIFSIFEEETSNKDIQFNQRENIQLTIQCSMMFSAVLTVNQLQSLIVIADNKQSIGIWTMEQMIYIDITIPPYLSLFQLKSLTAQRTENYFLLYFNNNTLLSSKVNVDKTNVESSIHFISFDQVNIYSMKKQFLATYNNTKLQIDLQNIDSNASHQSIQLNNECEELIFDESASYLFLLVKPRVLLMYRINDGRQLAKLCLYDFSSFMIADNDFIVLAMKDRRLLTLMIADPDDPILKAKINALPSRYLSQAIFIQVGSNQIRTLFFLLGIFNVQSHLQQRNLFNI